MKNDLWLLLSITLVNFMALASPGPNFVMVTQMAMQRDRRYAVLVGLGIATGTAIWGTAVAIGLSSLIAALPWLHTALVVAGGTYLVWIGVKMWRAPELVSGGSLSDPAGLPARGYLRGLATNLLNPKSAAYYASTFAVFFTPSTPSWVKVSAIAAMVAMSVLWHVALATIFSTAFVRASYFKVQRLLNRIAGTIIAGFGVKLLLSR